MGRVAGWIDGIALGLIAYGAAFLYFFHTTGSAAAGALLAVLPATLLSWAYRRWALRRYRRRTRARQARGMVERLARLPEEAARAQAARFAGFAGVLLQRHPKGRPLDADEVLALWRGAKSDPLEIATTGAVSDAAWQAAEELTAPGVLLLDGHRLADRYERSGLALDKAPRPRRRLALRIPKKRAKHCAIYGCAMLGVYLFTGLWTYLAASIILLALMSLALRRPVPPPRRPA